MTSAFDFPARARWSVLATSTPTTVTTSASAVVVSGSLPSQKYTMTTVKKGSHVLMTCVKETESSVSDTLVKSVPHSSSTADPASGTAHRS